ncbi:MAG: ABC transporter permease [Defluviitaleaceae bacterium]|nr:ABC transporter permease [Defluviitaleaceae bacterium]
MYKEIFSIINKEFLYFIRQNKVIFFEIILPITSFLPLILTVWFLEGNTSYENFAYFVGTEHINNYYVIAFFGFIFFNISENLATLLERELYLNTLEQILLTPIKYISIIIGWFIYLCIKSIIYITVFYILAILIIDTSVVNIPLLLIGFTLMMLHSFILGTVMVIITLYLRKADAIIFTLVGILPIISCIVFPIQILPLSIQLISKLLPTTYLFDLIKYSLSGSRMIFDVWVTVLILFISSLIMFFLSIIFYKKSFERLKICGIMKY